MCHHKFIRWDVQKVCILKAEEWESGKKWIDEWLRFGPEVLGVDWHNQILLTKLKHVCDVFVLFYMSSKFIVIVDILV